MYDYRKMTPEERLAVVEYRRSRRYPLHKPPHFEQGAGWYLITAACFEHRRHFSAPKELQALEHRLHEALSEAELACAAWVIMPNHYHLLVLAESLASVGKAIGRVHGRSSRYANLRDGTAGRLVWYKYSDRKMRSDRHFWATMHYIAYNPVKHGYVPQMDDWLWSSVHEMIERYGREWVAQLVDAYPLGDYGAQWDEFEPLELPR